MPKVNSISQSWRFFHYARKYLKRQTLYRIFGTRNARTIDLWCEDPLTCDKDEKAFDPIKGLRNMLALLDDVGHVGVVRSCLVYLASGTSITLDLNDSVQELKCSIGEEILADYWSVSELHKAIEAKRPLDEVKESKVRAIEEIERTFAKYARDYE